MVCRRRLTGPAYVILKPTFLLVNLLSQSTKRPEASDNMSASQICTDDLPKRKSVPRAGPACPFLRLPIVAMRTAAVSLRYSVPKQADVYGPVAVRRMHHRPIE